MSAIDVSGGGVGQPATYGFQVSPSNTDELEKVTRAIYVGGTGDVALRTMSGSIIVLIGVVVGSILPIRAVKIYATGTTATNIVGLV